MNHGHFLRYMLSYKPTGKKAWAAHEMWMGQIWGAAMDERLMHDLKEESGTLNMTA